MNPARLPSPARLCFLPDPHEAERLDRANRSDLIGSLEDLVGRCREVLPIDGSALTAWIASLRDEPSALSRLGPAAYAIYAHLVFALLRDDHHSAITLFGELAELRPLSTPFEILQLCDPALDGQRERYLNILDIDSLTPESATPVDPQVQAGFESDHRWAMQQLERDLPELAGEIQALVRQLILVQSSNRDRQTGFDGGSSPMLWGALFVHAAPQRSRLELLELLVHESAHLLLYACTQHEPLVLNEEAERYPSPLRADPRPMEGIFHATWVSARMTYAMERLSRSPTLDAVLRQQALAAAHTDRAHVEAGLAVIRAHAQLTPTGRQLIDAAAAALRPLGLSPDAWP